MDMQITSTRDLENEFADMLKPFDVCSIRPSFLDVSSSGIFRVKRRNTTGLLVRRVFYECAECSRVMCIYVIRRHSLHASRMVISNCH
jgi:hypothetical protein